ncbi:hypothetical protein C7441_12136 [Pseudaminobacter salicylatoxidans]|uniref:Uncharacterized protein n=1 Tax=Pseudaminobacter salicylatoxidans TaxID=93369 RepID=A0A316BP07_PSESE|nr:hypothetical protein [Pseudaminobacter salicylatoxidans]PWJ75254.1 hypothetical protein C7441_12136 [Pseudaminobacter salicylatoxidans]
MIIALLRITLARGLLKLSDAILAVVEWLLYRGPEKSDRVVPKGRAHLQPAELLLLGSIVGVGIAGVWIGIVWRAAQ